MPLSGHSSPEELLYKYSSIHIEAFQETVFNIPEFYLDIIKQTIDENPFKTLCAEGHTSHLEIKRYDIIINH